MTRYQLALCHLQFGKCLSLFSRTEGLFLAALGTLHHKLYWSLGGFSNKHSFKACKLVWKVSVPFELFSGVSPALRQNAGLLWFSLLCEHWKSARICKNLHEKNGQRNWGPPRLHNAKVRTYFRFNNWSNFSLIPIYPISAWLPRSAATLDFSLASLWLTWS